MKLRVKLYFEIEQFVNSFENYISWFSFWIYDKYHRIYKRLFLNSLRFQKGMFTINLHYPLNSSTFLKQKTNTFKTTII